MKIRTLNELIDALDEDFAWRRKELTSVRNAVQLAAVTVRPTYIRAGIALLYAHWEGFVKGCSESYLSFVSFQRLQYNELNPSLLALCLRSRLVSLNASYGSSANTEFANLVLTGLETRAQVPDKGAIETKANLNSERLGRIVGALGLDFTPYELKTHLIDAQLLNWRNTIAHGQYLCPSESDFEALYQQVGDLIRDFKDQVANAAATGLYKRPAHTR